MHLSEGTIKFEMHLDVFFYAKIVLKLTFQGLNAS